MATLNPNPWVSWYDSSHTRHRMAAAADLLLWMFDMARNACADTMEVPRCCCGAQKPLLVLLLLLLYQAR